MTVSQSVVEGFIEQLAPLGRITTRRMFGSVALYCDSVVFAIIYQDVLYLKVDDETRAAFDAEACGPFRYPLKDGSVQVLATYHHVPDRLLDDSDELRQWARTAVGTARRRAAKPVKPKRSRSPTPQKTLRAR